MIFLFRIELTLGLDGKITMENSLVHITQQTILSYVQMLLFLASPWQKSCSEHDIINIKCRRKDLKITSRNELFSPCIDANLYLYAFLSFTLIEK